MSWWIRYEEEEEKENEQEADLSLMEKPGASQIMWSAKLII